LFVQSDGNAILRGTDNKAVWSSKTYGHPGAELVVDDGGRIAVTVGTLAIWLDGIPRGIYTGRPNANLQFPVRGMFYYPVSLFLARSTTTKTSCSLQLTPWFLP
jgi:hypothetical protein